MDELDMDMKCEGRCAAKEPGDWDFMIGAGVQVRWNPIAGMALCCDCQDKWASWSASGYGPKPAWVKG